MRFLRWLLAGRARSEQAVECARQFPYGIDAEAYGGGWTSPLSQAERRAHRSQGWTAREFRNAIHPDIVTAKTLVGMPALRMAVHEPKTDLHSKDIPVLWSHSAGDYPASGSTRV